ncbi:hypothetical protein DFP72DRAFT_853939 [Ephemerocybe angulata]|uniref:Uncharacterized protein n=1 Tax=Ephemerocybe angulata TaxID=980116 RepID=A0A8H6HKB6_9AGAR|nr:hypothetical protein DFP72DRAFT_853939 [Tulosesus angulatus]
MPAVFFDAEENDISPLAAVSQIDFSLRGRSLKKQRTLSPQSAEDFEAFINAGTPVEHFLKIYLGILECRDSLAKIAAGTAWTMPDDVKVYILSPGLLFYKKNTGPATALPNNVRLRCGAQLCGWCHRKTRLGVRRFLSRPSPRQITDVRHHVKSQVSSGLLIAFFQIQASLKAFDSGNSCDIASLAFACVRPAKIKPMAGVFIQIAFLRWVMATYPNVKPKKYWDKVDTQLKAVRKNAATIEREAAFTIFYDDIAKYGNPNPELPPVSSDRLEDWVKNIEAAMKIPAVPLRDDVHKPIYEVTRKYSPEASIGMAIKVPLSIEIILAIGAIAALKAIQNTWTPFDASIFVSTQPSTKEARAAHTSIAIDCRHAQNKVNCLLQSIEELEKKLRVKVRWTEGDSDWEAAKTLVVQRAYRRALDQVERIQVTETYLKGHQNCTEELQHRCVTDEAASATPDMRSVPGDDPMWDFANIWMCSTCNGPQCPIKVPILAQPVRRTIKVPLTSGTETPFERAMYNGEAARLLRRGDRRLRWTFVHLTTEAVCLPMYGRREAGGRLEFGVGRRPVR